MPADSLYEFGAYQAARGSVTWLPRGYKRDGSKRGVVYLHGAGELSATPLNGAGGKLAEATLLAQIASIYPVLMPDCGVFGAGNTTDSDNWGNTNARTEFATALARFQTAAGGGAKGGKVILVGFSMGHALSLTIAQATPGVVQGIIGILPVNDLDDIRDNNRGGFRASISNAWGTGAWVSNGNPALPAGANPALPGNLTNVQAIPQRMYYASDDAICTPATVGALIANYPITTAVNMGAGGHTDASIGHASAADVLATLAAFG